MPPIAMLCETCGKTFYRNKYKVDRASRHFCSKPCYDKAKVILMAGSNNPNWNSTTTNCDECGAPVHVNPFQIKRWKRHFCNMTCASAWRTRNIVGENHHNWTGGEIEYYGPDWPAQQRAARKRDNYRCQSCGKKQKGRALDVHHVRPFRMFGYIPGENELYKNANRLENLVTLCNSCHKRVEHGKLSVQLKLI